MTVELLNTTNSRGNVHCTKCNRVFYRPPNLLKKTKRCPYCEGNSIYDFNHFRDKLNKLGILDVYSLISKTYTGWNGTTKLRCKCGKIVTFNNNALLNNRVSKIGCDECSTAHRLNLNKINRETAYKNYIKTYKSKYFTCEKYLGSGTFLYRCKKCTRTFEGDKKAGYRITCPHCYSQACTTNQFIEKSKKVHGNSFNYSKTNYVNAHTHVVLICNSCGTEFKQRPYNNLYGYGCPNCNKGKSFSKLSIKLIETLSKKTRLKFKHALNGGEEYFSVRGHKKGVYLDGYNKTYNIGIEFNGDCFHGNPRYYKSNSTCLPFGSKVKAKDLYTKTKRKACYLRSKGIHLISVWESDYIKDPKGVIHKCIERINTYRSKL